MKYLIAFILALALCILGIRYGKHQEMIEHVEPKVANQTIIKVIPGQSVNIEVKR